MVNSRSLSGVVHLPNGLMGMILQVDVVTKNRFPSPFPYQSAKPGSVDSANTIAVMKHQGACIE